MMLLQFTSCVAIPDDIVITDHVKLLEQIESLLSFYYGYTKIIDYEERVNHENTERHEAETLCTVSANTNP